MEYISHNTEETKEIAKKIAEVIKNFPDSEKATVVGLSGELGAGKTTFMKFFAEEFGIEEHVQSPTFIIMRIFEIPENKNISRFKKLIHIDAYRLETGNELLNLGWNELLNHSGNLICIEWPEKVSDVVSPSGMLNFSHAEAEETERTIKTDLGTA